MANWVLKFISGKYQGNEYPLEEGRELRIGRSSDSDLVLVEDMVSRNHAVLRVTNDTPHLVDLGSTNGSFVNGERVTEVVLQDGDRLLFGTSVIKLFRVVGESRSADWSEPPADDSEDELEAEPTSKAMMAADMLPSAMAGAGTFQVSGASTRVMAAIPEIIAPPPPEASPAPAAPAAPAASSASSFTSGVTMAGAMSGLLEEVGLSDLLQLFSTSRKSGALRLIGERERASVWLRDGRVIFAEIEGMQLAPDKAAYRVLGWTQGTFILEPSASPQFENELEMSTEALMMEAMRLMDELENARHRLPDATDHLRVVQPLEAPLRELDAESLDLVQQVWNDGRVGAILDHSADPDLEVLQGLADLIKAGYLEKDPS